MQVIKCGRAQVMRSFPFSEPSLVASSVRGRFSDGWPPKLILSLRPPARGLSAPTSPPEAGSASGAFTTAWAPSERTLGPGAAGAEPSGAGPSPVPASGPHFGEPLAPPASAAGCPTEGAAVAGAAGMQATASDLGSEEGAVSGSA